MAGGAPQSNKRTGEAAQSYFGYSIQLNRMLLYLIEAKPDDIVWLEHFDDVGVTHPDGTITLQQCTTSQTSKPVTDKAEKFWKTIANWVIGAQKGWYEPDTTDFIFFVLQNHTPGTLVKELEAVSTTEEAHALLEKISDKFWGKGPAYPNKNTVSDTLKKHIEVILNADSEVVVNILARFKIKYGKDGIKDSLDAAVKDEVFASPSQARRESFIQSALGWLKETTDALLEQNSIAEVSKAEFLKYSQTYASTHFFKDYLSSVASEPSQEDASLLVAQEPMFIRQLRLINFKENDLLVATNQYLMSRDNIAAWAKAGEINEQDAKRYEADLLHHWRMEKMGLEAETIASDVKFGIALSARCLVKNMKLEGKDVPNNFTPGYYHNLADAPKEQLTIGWNRNFQTLLSNATSEEEES